MAEQSLIEQHDLIGEEIEELTAIRVGKADGTTTLVDLRTVVEMILDNLKLELVHRKEFVLTKLEKKERKDESD